MNESRLMKQITAVFSIFLVLVYLGAGVYFIFYFNNSILDKPVRVIAGIAFIFYGIYRAYRTVISIIEVFFTKNDKNW